MKDIISKFFSKKISADKFFKSSAAFLRAACVPSGGPEILDPAENIVGFSTEKKRFLHDFCKCFPYVYPLGGLALRSADDDPAYVSVFAVKCTENLSGSDCRRKQFDFAQKIILFHGSCAGGDHQQNCCAIFIFSAPDHKSFRLSLLEKAETAESFKRHSFFVSSEQNNHTFCTRMANVRWKNIDDLKETFEVEKLRDSFFREYRDICQAALTDAADKKILKTNGAKRIRTSEKAPALQTAALFKTFADPEKILRDHTKKMLMRLLILQFFILREGGCKKSLKELFGQCSKTAGKHFYEKVADPLLFDVSNENYNRDNEDVPGLQLPDNSRAPLPFQNLCFFEKDQLDEIQDAFPAKYFEKIFDLFERYDFTLDENDPADSDIGIDPEMTGRIFESMQDDSKNNGVYYTPKRIVRYMCEESLIAYLGGSSAIRNFIKNIDHTDRIDTDDILRKLKDIKICDPATGSGAFLMEMLNMLCRLRLQLESADSNSETLSDKKVRIKKEIIKNNLYGTDIDAAAADIARLRLCFSIAADEDKPSPFPNLDYRIMQGNSLLEEYLGCDLSEISRFMETEKKTNSSGTVLQKSSDDFLSTPEAVHKAIDCYFSIRQPDLKKKYKERIDTKIRNCIKAQLKQEPSSADRENKLFFLWHTYFGDVFRKKGGFDMIIGNPPYIGEKNHKQLFAPIKNSISMKQYYRGKMDYFYFFFHLALDLLHTDSVGAFITTNYYPTAAGAKKLREDLQKRAVILEICNFGELKLFDSAQGQHNMITLFQKKSSPETLCHLIDVHTPGRFCEEIIERIEKKTLEQCMFKQIDQTELFEGEEHYMRVSPEGHPAGDHGNAIFHKMTVNSCKLSEIASVNTGIMGGCDKLNRKNIGYVTNRSGTASEFLQGDGVFILDKKNGRDTENIEFLKKYTFFKPFFKNSDIRKYSVKSEPEKYIIFSSPDNSECDKVLIKQHLNKYRTLLEHIRKINHENTGFWYLLRRGTRNVQIFDCPKIVSPQRSRYNVFGYHEGEWYASADVYYITHTKQGYSLKFLSGLLNSKLYYYWLYHKGKRKGEYLELYQKPMSEIPVIRIKKQDDQIPISGLVDKILRIKAEDPCADTGSLEQEIDSMVYALYGLTPQEISIVEQCFKGPVSGKSG